MQKEVFKTLILEGQAEIRDIELYRDGRIKHRSCSNMEMAYPLLIATKSSHNRCCASA